MWLPYSWRFGTQEWSVTCASFPSWSQGHVCASADIPPNIQKLCYLLLLLIHRYLGNLFLTGSVASTRGAERIRAGRCRETYIYQEVYKIRSICCDRRIVSKREWPILPGGKWIIKNDRSSLFFRSHKTSASEGETSEADGVRGHRAQNWWIGMCCDLLWGEEKETAHGWKEGRRNNFFIPRRGDRTFWTSHHPEKFPASQILFWTIPCIKDFYDKVFYKAKSTS